MIGYLSVTNFLLLCVFAFGFLAVAVYLAADAIDARRAAARSEVAAGTASPSAPTPNVSADPPRSIRQVIDGDDEPFMLDSLDEKDAWLERHGIGRRQA